jgi:peptidoglycan/LPS O-acetylase OafA/YrhL
MQYRAEIDGLRAIAVIPVILFHAGLETFSGGFVGVDVFFVISGYLITSILLKELDTGQFSLTGFYERRTRRIVPALFFVMAACLLPAWLLLLPLEHQEFSQSLIAVPFFSSNFLFWRQSGYFDTAAELKPLLHTWSLAVEEQYYIFFPLLLLLLWRIGRRVTWVVIVAIALSSLGLAIALSQTHSTANFYLLPSRAWELLIGSLIAYHLHSQSEYSLAMAWKQILSLLGFLLIVASVFLFNHQTPFPGLYTLIPVSGTAMLILYARPGVWIHQLLSHRALVAVGLVSYSAYLWHQPIFAFTRHLAQYQPTKILMFSMSLCAFVLAFLTWRWIEKPFRDKKKISRRGIFSLLLSGTLFFSAIGIAGHYTEGFPKRLDLKEVHLGEISHASFFEYISQRYATCQPDRIAMNALRSGEHIRCQQADALRDVDMALIGDSHAEHLFVGMAQAIPQRNPVFYIRDSLVSISNPEYKDIFDHVLKNPSIRTVVLAAQWSKRIKEVSPSTTLEKDLMQTIKVLQSNGKSVYLLDNVPRFNVPAVNCKYGLGGFAQAQSCKATRKSVERYEARYSSALEAVVRESYPAKLIRLKEYFCDDLHCSMVQQGVVMYRDDNHLNIEGSIYVGQRLVKDEPSLSVVQLSFSLR